MYLSMSSYRKQSIDLQCSFKLLNCNKKGQQAREKLTSLISKKNSDTFQTMLSDKYTLMHLYIVMKPILCTLYLQARSISKVI